MELATDTVIHSRALLFVIAMTERPLLAGHAKLSGVSVFRHSASDLTTLTDFSRFGLRSSTHGKGTFSFSCVWLPEI